MADALTLRTYPEAWVIIRCDECSREGRYRRETLIERYGADTELPHIIGQVSADCENRAYGPHYPCRRARLIDPASGRGWADRAP